MKPGKRWGFLRYENRIQKDILQMWGGKRCVFEIWEGGGVKENTHNSKQVAKKYIKGTENQGGDVHL